MLINEKFKFEKTKRDGGHYITLIGTIDEDTDFSEIAALGGPLVFNFEGVTSINSCGVRAWVNLLKQLANPHVFYDKCPPLIVRQMNMVPSFVGSAKVLSVYIPYVCDNCDKEKMVLADEKKFLKRPLDISAVILCDSCKKEEMEFDGTPEQYFAFTK